ncbi:hypothetical protein GON03_15570 [Nocardioides sp. MAH-18]|uniref:YCII-related domain-containing protein n=1 Tax=Nocardioides agri TaxID=2682843 RepID=A0A6L6XV32_9ACTN|nr:MULTISPECIES: YciI family protein [unclassified Nocardioides]MBA2955753.1 hypothetical protein [Nocardioides sp. CGMCC 1.13656]MVQ50603.1 hypothetical protein [Nocardioides sp. MAH-18]
MEFFCYHRDRDGSTPLRAEMTEEHWSYMDRFDLVERGPTFDDETPSGSVHVVDLPDVAAARDFVLDEPCYQAGAYRDVLLRRTAWTRPGGTATAGVLAIGFSEPTPYDGLAVPGDGLVGLGPLLSDDGARLLGAAVLAATEDEARTALAGFTAVEVHRWERGGRR